ncbi:MAG: CRISPR-associated helicase Cas3' [Bacillota bacterium]|nr:CRISPR-associated helicase Cas3' [Bacillota bacterium]
MAETYLAHKYEGRIQTVAEHCRNTAVLCRSYGRDMSLGETAYLAGLYHDVGKSSAAFQDYLRANGDIYFGGKAGGKIDHSYAGARFLYENCCQTTAEERIAAELLSIAIASHHGTYDWLRLDGEDYFTHRLNKDDYYEEIEDQCRRDYLSLSELTQAFIAAVGEVEEKLKVITEVLGKNKKFYCGMLARLLTSLVIDADREDTIAFERGASPAGTWGTGEFWQQALDNLESKLETFSLDSPLARQRMEISQLCRERGNLDSGVYRLMIPTGGGKTLASLGFGLKHALLHKKTRIFYIAPFTSILEQNADVFREIIDNDKGFLEHHCNVEDDSQAYELYSQSWHCPVIATTMVQFLNALFSYKTSAVRRMHALTNAVIIVDEVQALPLKCLCLFNGAVNFLSHITGSTVVLCSATQPRLDTIPQLPLIYSREKDIVNSKEGKFSVFKRTRIVDLTKTPLSYDEAGDFIREKYQKNRNALVIVNTKKAAAALYDLVKEKIGHTDLVVHLSTNMCPQHRRDVVTAMKKDLTHGKKVLCISTQLIEAGVDISFDCVIRSLAGWDSIAQSAGRCNRHCERDCKEVYVIKLSEESLMGLPEISEAQQQAQRVFRTADPERDFLDPEFMERFYRYYYGVKADMFKYPLKELRTDILDLLSGNHLAVEAYEAVRGCKPPHFFRQCFGTGGRSFKVIEDNSFGVVVPYDQRANQVIESLNSYFSENNSKELQKYSVSVYPHTLRKLKDEEAIYMPRECGIWVLRDEFYSKDIGIELKQKGMELDML